MTAPKSWTMLAASIVAALVVLGGPPTGSPQALVGAAEAVVGGTDVPDGTYPWLVSLQVAGSEGSEGHFCGGTVLSRRWVLTAAHCTDPEDFDVQVVVGRTDLREDGGQVLGITEYRVHPDYAHSATSDVALWRTDAPMRVPTVRLATPADDVLETPGTPLTVVGWGVDNPASMTMADRQRQAELDAIDDAECERLHSFQGFAADTEVCAYAPGRDACSGDSGGPLVATRATGEVVQVGIPSYGLACAVPPFPGVYAELNSPGILTWIRSNVRRLTRQG